MPVPESIPVVQVNDCPVEVHYRDIGAQSVGVNAAHTGEFGTFNDLDMAWYEPPHNDGDLLLFVLISSKGGESAPAGYTSVGSATWDNAPTTPLIHGANSTTDGPASRAEVYQLVAYRIASGSGGSDFTPAGTYTGYTYTDGGLGFNNDFAAARVYRFELLEMGGDYPVVNDQWPVTPVIVGPVTSADYQMELGPGGGAFGETYPSGDTPGPNAVSVSDVTADHDGNHIYMTLVSVHGPVLADGVTFPTGEQENSMSLFPREKKTTGTPGIDTYGGLDATTGYSQTSNPGMNEHIAHGFMSNTDYFNPFRPESWVPSQGPAENGFADTTCEPGRGVKGHVGADWSDGFIGVAGTDFYIWDLIGGVAMQQIVIQGPETFRPPNDDLAESYNVVDCPVTIVECVFGPTAEPGETYDGLGNARNSSVWFTFVPTEDQIGLVISTDTESSDASLGDFPPYFSEYDTILVVYDSDMTVIASDDDGGFGDQSRVTVDMTAGQTYYIQVVGWGGDEGRLLLTIPCEGVAAYWGVLASAM